MGHIIKSHNTPVPPEAVWKVLDDFGGVAAWNSAVAHAHLLNKKVGVGQERHCDFDAKGKNWVRERIIERGDDHIVIDFFETSAPMKFMRARIRVTPTRGGSRIDFAMDLKPKFGLLGKLMEVTMMKPQFNKNINAFIADLGKAAKRYA